MRVIIKELEPYYQTIYKRASHLEEFAKCNYLHHKGYPQDPTNKNLLFGTMAHNILQAYMVDMVKGQQLRELVANYNMEWFEMIGKYMALINQHRDEYNVIGTEMKMTVEIEFGDYLFVIEGTTDLVCKDEKGWFLADIKTSKAEWKQETFDVKIQKKLYTYLFAYMFGWDKVYKFDYLIFTKHKKPRFQPRSYTPNKEVLEAFMKKLLEDYMFSGKHKARHPNRGQHCWGCPLRKLGCPAWEGSLEEKVEGDDLDFL